MSFSLSKTTGISNTIDGIALTSMAHYKPVEEVERLVGALGLA